MAKNEERKPRSKKAEKVKESAISAAGALATSDALIAEPDTVQGDLAADVDGTEIIRAPRSSPARDRGVSADGCAFGRRAGAFVTPDRCGHVR